MNELSRLYSAFRRLKIYDISLISNAYLIESIFRKCGLSNTDRKRIVRAGYQKAIVATAHKILQYAYYVLKNQTPYQKQYPAGA